jgi:hypothetical protein
MDFLILALGILFKNIFKMFFQEWYLPFLQKDGKKNPPNFFRGVA